MDGLPELPFEKMLSYLSLADLIKFRAVSRAWKMKIDNLKVKSLCHSERRYGFIFQKKRWASGAFAQNFICCPQPERFFSEFGQSILSNLKRLRLCGPILEQKSQSAFSEIFQSFGQLEELFLINSGALGSFKLEVLSMPMLRSIYIDSIFVINRLTLDAPRLQTVKLSSSLGFMNLVHMDSVERVTIYDLEQIRVRDLKNLKKLCVRTHSGIDSTLLAGLKQLNEVHLIYRGSALEILEQKQRYGRVNLKVYLCGLLLNGVDDLLIRSNQDYRLFTNEFFVYLTKNLSRLANEIPLQEDLRYSAIERVAPELAINVLGRLTDLEKVAVGAPVQDVQRFLDLLKSFENIVDLEFQCDQPQELLDRLPEYCAVQKLTISRTVAGSSFWFQPWVFRLKHLKYLTMSIDPAADVESIRKIFEFEFISWFVFLHTNQSFQVRFEYGWICIYFKRESRQFLNRNDAIEYIVQMLSE